MHSLCMEVTHLYLLMKIGGKLHILCHFFLADPFWQTLSSATELEEVKVTTLGI